MSPNELPELIAIHQRESRIDAGRKLRSLYLSLGWKRADLASFLQMSERAVYRWEAGQHRVPSAVTKLLRLMNRMELPGKAWAGWSFSRDQLWSPEGYGFSGRDFAWLNLTSRRSAMFGVLYREREDMRREIDRLGAELNQAKLDLQVAEGHSGLVELALQGALWEVDQAANDSPETRFWPVHQVRRPRAVPAPKDAEGGDVLVTRHQRITGETLAAEFQGKPGAAGGAR